MAHEVHGGRVAAAARTFGLPEAAFVDFSANINPFAPVLSPAEWERCRAALSRYSDAEGETLRHRLSSLYAVKADAILPTSGAAEALYLAARLFADPSRKTAIVEPAFGDYRRAFAAAGGDWEQVVLPPDLWHQPIAAWADRLASFDAVVLGNPNNPTGSFQDRAGFAAVLREACRRGQSWIVDEAFIEFVAGHEKETLLALLDECPTLIVVRSLTKSWGIPGLRLGFLATANVSWIERLRGMQPPWSVGAVAEAWAGLMLTSERYGELLSGLDRLRTAKSRFITDLSSVDGLRVHPVAANFLLLELADSSLSAAAIYEELGCRGLLVRTCDSFRGMSEDRFLRVAVRSRGDNERLAEELARLCAAPMRRAA